MINVLSQEISYWATSDKTLYFNKDTLYCILQYYSGEVFLSTKSTV